MIARGRRAGFTCVLGAVGLAAGCSVPSVPEGLLGCGTSSDCPSGQSCYEGCCAFSPDTVTPCHGAPDAGTSCSCSGRSCGPDSCGNGSCGTCSASQGCSANGQCCAATGYGCTTQGNCCNYLAGTGYCADFGSGGVCADSCTSSSDCDSSCCVSVTTGKVCGPASACATSCSNPGPGICDTAGDLYCGAACCSPTYPYYCAANNTCYALASEAAAECGSSCDQCAASCVYATTTGTCAAGQVNCGSGHCCSTQFPFYCSFSNLCYATAAGAVDACGAYTCDSCH